jgi:hypothetical protein
MRFAVIFSNRAMVTAIALSMLLVSTAQTVSGNVPPDTASTLVEAFTKGVTRLQFRTFFMATDNERGLSDYYAWAGGGSIHYHTASLYGLRLGVGGMFNYNIASADLMRPDPVTNAPNRYEIGLFDVASPGNKRDLDRLEELWLQYERRKFKVTLGKQLLQTPFINFQDGRMRPTAVGGIWAESNPLRHAKLEGGWLWKISPRSTVDWYRIGASIGLYPKGLNPDGGASGYPENLQGKGVGLLGVKRTWGERVELQVWNQYVDNIFNTVFLQADFSVPFKKSHTLRLGFQGIRQDAVADGGNPDQQRTYFPRGTHSNGFSVQAGWGKHQWQALLAYTRITSDGRFLSPREWGREPFYTFMARERIEGAGNSQAIVGRLQWHSTAKRWRTELAYGHFYLPDIKDTRLNKYAFPAFNQLNADIRYAFSGWLSGLNAQLLLVRKGRLGEVYGNQRAVINRVNMWQYNLILNYNL